MTFRQALILGLLQGLTEFLPVSSSGHLVIGQKFLALDKPPVLFDILVHLGTFLSILIFFNRKIFRFFKKISNLIIIFIASLPAAIFGFFLNDYLESVFNSLGIVSFCLLINSFFLFSTSLIKKAGQNLSQLKLKKGFVIGIFQALALFPGISRSGSTIVAGLHQNLSRRC
jgi:undecaprenyl-diphosphatase